MAKVAIIGAGSIVFCQTLMLDIMGTPGLEGTEFALMAPSTNRTSMVEAFAKRVIGDNKLPAKVWKTTDRRAALDGADYVIATFQVGGVDAFEQDYEIPYKYGVDQCIGDTLGPGGIFRSLRSIPTMLAMAQDIKEVAPKAYVLNYVNPMATMCWTLGTTGAKFVGLCHGVQTTLDLISGYVDVPKERIDFLCAGINHMGWFLELKHNGVDLYPKLRERFEQPEYYINEKVRGEVFRHFGYFMTESTGHLSEYVPWFRSSERAREAYCDEPGFGGETGAYYTFCRKVAAKYEGQDILKDQPTALPKRSVEYGSYIIEALETGKTFRLNGNVINHGMITNLPADCCAEGPLFVDRTGIHQTIVGDLPSQCAALNMTNVNVQRLTVEAGMTGDAEKVVMACAMDPLTSATLTLKETRDMVTEMLECEAQWLPQFAGKRPRPTPIIATPPGTPHAKVPVDPALAINARFGELGK
jgi:alpha-galactosidase